MGDRPTPLVQWLGNWVIQISCPTETIPFFVTKASTATEAHLPLVKCVFVAPSVWVKWLQYRTHSPYLAPRLRMYRIIPPPLTCLLLCNKAQWQFYLNRHSLTKSICVPKHIHQLQCMAASHSSSGTTEPTYSAQCSWTTMLWTLTIHHETTLMPLCQHFVTDSDKSGSASPTLLLLNRSCIKESGSSLNHLM